MEIFASKNDFNKHCLYRSPFVSYFHCIGSGFCKMMGKQAVVGYIVKKCPFDFNEHKKYFISYCKTKTFFLM